MFESLIKPNFSHDSSEATTQQVDRTLAFVLLRVLLGVNFFGHGAIRLLHGDRMFAQGMATQMANTPLPAAIAYGFGLVVPYLELLLGVLLLCGIVTRLALASVLLFLSMLMVGLTMRQDWPTAGSLLLYGLVAAALLFYRAHYDTTWTGLLARFTQGT